MSTHELETRRLLAACSMLLSYPDEAAEERWPLLAEHLDDLPSHARAGVGETVSWLRGTGLLRSQQHYVENFDRRRKACLYLTYFLNGDTRRRGMALVEFKEAYHAAGLDLGPEELPDFVPVVLELGALGEVDTCLDLLARHRSGLELLEAALRKFGSPYAATVGALLTVVPHRAEGPTAEQLAAAGPPTEVVGLDPFFSVDSLTAGARS